VHAYVTHYDSCQRNKSRHGKAEGHLQPLPVPDRTFPGITMDLIVKLPTTHSTPTYDSILVIVDKLTIVRLNPCREAMNASHTLQLVYTPWFSLFGLPEQIVSDRGSLFNNVFNADLLSTIGIRQSLSTAYHPQTDGQTEHANCVIEDMLRHYVSPTQTNWHTF
jgi:transposase InsO family protein